ncbi:ribonuclease H-like domain-containing protein, partial [Tanacetum coccineum]
SDNGTEFKNKVLDDFCRERGIKREYSVARTPQQNGVAKKGNRTLIEAARTMLADSKLPTTFWAKAVSTACYVQHRVLAVKPYYKTPYELFRGFKPALSFMRPFGCHVTILNTLDSLGKFDGKSDEGFFVGYSLISKAFTVYNTRTRRVEENLHIGFLENEPMIEGNGTSEEVSQDCIVMPICKDTSYFDSPTKDVDNGEPKTADDAQKQVEDGPNNENAEQERFVDDSSTKDINAAGQQVNTASHDLNTGSLKLNAVGPSVNTASPNDQDSTEEEPEVDLGNITNSYIVPTLPYKNPKDPLLTLSMIWVFDVSHAFDHIIMFAVCACARFQVTPKTSHLLAVKRIFRYLKGKPTLSLWYSRDSPFELVAYTDSDYAGATLDRKSTIGGCQFLGNRLISWQCKKQTVVATSTTEAEYVAAASCCGQVLWIQNQLLDYGYNFMNTVININNNNLLTKGFDAGRFQYLVSNDMGTKVATVSNSYHLRHCLRGGISQEVGTPRYLSLVVPLTKVGDEAVHKELGDRMERAATTASSLEAEQDSGSGPRCQDTILGDVNAQTRFEITSIQSIDPPLSRGYTLGSGEDSMKLIGIDEIFPKFAETHNVVAFLEKPKESDGFAEIIDFLKASSVSYALTVNPVIYASCIEQFWATAKKVLIVFQLLLSLKNWRVWGMKSLLKSPQWKYYIHTITQGLSAKSTAWNEFSSSMASLIICLATNQKFNLSKYIFDAMVKHLDGGVKFLLYPLFANIKRAGKDFSGRITPLFDTMMVQPKDKPSKKAQRQEGEVPQDEAEHEENVPTPSNDPQLSGEDSMQLTDLMILCTKLQTQVLDLQKAKDAQAKEIATLKKRIQRLERRKLSRPTGLKRLSKVDIDANVDVSLVDETQERQNDDLMFDSGVLEDNVMHVEAKVDGKD